MVPTAGAGKVSRSASTKELVSIDAYSYRENCTSAHDEANNAVIVSDDFSPGGIHFPTNTLYAIPFSILRCIRSMHRDFGKIPDML